MLHQRQIVWLFLLFHSLGFGQSVGQTATFSNDITRLDSLYSYLDPKYSYHTPTGDSGFTILGEWRWGSCIAAAAVGNYVYIGNGGLLQVLDVSQPATPRVVWEMKTGLVRDIKMQGQYAYVLFDAGMFMILDISAPRTPIVLSQIPVYGISVSAAPNGPVVYVTSIIGVVYVVDVSNPYNPFLRGYIIATGAYLSRVASYGTFVYYVSGHQNQGLAMMIIDASNPDSLVAVDRFFDIGCGGHSLLVSDTLLFVGAANYCIGTGASVKIYSVSQPQTPQLLGEVIIGRQINSITRAGNYLYAGTSDSGLYAIDISSLSQPVIVDHIRREIPALGWNHAVAFSNNMLFSTQQIGLWILDASQLDSLRPISFFPTGDNVLGIATRDNLAFLADGEAGVWTLDVADPDSIRNISNLNIGGSASKIVVSGNYAYLVVEAGTSPVDTVQGLWILDVANPADPFVVSHLQSIVHYSGNGIPSSISKSGEYVFITKADPLNDSALAIINVTNPAQPFTESVFRSATWPHEVIARDTIALLATEMGGLRILSVRDPSTPFEITSLMNRALSFNLRNNFIFLSADTGFAVVDFSTPGSPQVVGTTRTSSLGVTVAVDSHHAYFGLDGIHVVQITPPSAPREVAVWLAGQYFSSLVTMRDSLLIAGSSQLFILRSDLTTSVEMPPTNTNPVSLELLQNYPNPFNSTTVIGFSLSKRSNVDLRIYSILGQEIQSLVHGEYDAGFHRIFFDGSNLASGVYFYRLRIETTVPSKRMLLIK